MSISLSITSIVGKTKVVCVLSMFIAALINGFETTIIYDLFQVTSQQFGESPSTGSISYPSSGLDFSFANFDSQQSEEIQTSTTTDVQGGGSYDDSVNPFTSVSLFSFDAPRSIQQPRDNAVVQDTAGQNDLVNLLLQHDQYDANNDGLFIGDTGESNSNVGSDHSSKIVNNGNEDLSIFSNIQGPSFTVSSQSYKQDVSNSQFPIATQSTPQHAPAPIPTQSSPAPIPAQSSQGTNSWIVAHNNRRQKHCTSPVYWSDYIAKSAQAHANGCNFQHSSSQYGENLFMGSGSGYSADYVVEAWYEEEAYYDYNNPGFSTSTGHFTQVVWASTSEIGCGVANCGGRQLIVCQYASAGNVRGQFSLNVNPPCY